ncbi:kinase-like protein [Saitoella complicata NRRL Y-17804]|nr:kinase-like protein [Saitoella complicata NRRL Y-17804]ODQ52558.1 kinase-like protein [Saitoella complicata NRRL Y-17804]GAO47506.1 hypothetical protein G7K_1711-t1 [Saitoella complicata NRRL Y-17804]
MEHSDNLSRQWTNPQQHGGARYPPQTSPNHRVHHPPPPQYRPHRMQSDPAIYSQAYTTRPPPQHPVSEHHVPGAGFNAMNAGASPTRRADVPYDYNDGPYQAAAEYNARLNHGPNTQSPRKGAVPSHLDFNFMHSSGSGMPNSPDRMSLSPMSPGTSPYYARDKATSTSPGFAPPRSPRGQGYAPKLSSTEQRRSNRMTPDRDVFTPLTPIARTEGPPRFKRVSEEGLRPIKGRGVGRRARPEGGLVSPLQALTMHLTTTYGICNPGFSYENSKNPRRVLTKPSKGVKNDGADNEDSDYILYVNDILGADDHANRYLILDILGQGTFGQVVKCQNMRTQELVAVKVVKNKPAYFNQSMMEVTILELLNNKLDPADEHHILRMKDTFIHKQHLCLVFELLSVNLYELIKQNQFRGLSTNLVRMFAGQLLDAMTVLNEAKLIHCDLKPENILLNSLESPTIKVIDFGSACHEKQTVYTYIQSRFYRSPEVLLGLPYSSSIDMWSLGCIMVELFLGLPLFPGSSEYNQVTRIVEMLGLPPPWMLEMGKQSGEFFERVIDNYGNKSYRLKSLEQYSAEHSTQEQPSKKYFSATTLPDIIKTYPMQRKGASQAEIDKEMQNRLSFVDFVSGLLNINPHERWSPQQAKMHPFITGARFTGRFTPPMNVRYPTQPATTRQHPVSQLPPPPTQQQMQKFQEQQYLAHQQHTYGGAATALPTANGFSSPYQGQVPVLHASPDRHAYGQKPSYTTSGTSSAMAYTPHHTSPGYNNAFTPADIVANHKPRHHASNRARAQTIVDNVPPQIQRVMGQLNPGQAIPPSPAYFPTHEVSSTGVRQRQSQYGMQEYPEEAGEGILPQFWRS